MITNHIGFPQIHLQFGHGAIHHAGRRFAATAAVVGMVWAKIDRIERSITLFQQALQPGMDGFQILEGEKASSDAGLVRDHHQPGAGNT